MGILANNRTDSNTADTSDERANSSAARTDATNIAAYHKGNGRKTNVARKAPMVDHSISHYATRMQDVDNEAVTKCMTEAKEITSTTAGEAEAFIHRTLRAYKIKTRIT